MEAKKILKLFMFVCLLFNWPAWAMDSDPDSKTATSQLLTSPEQDLLRLDVFQQHYLPLFLHDAKALADANLSSLNELPRLILLQANQNMRPGLMVVALQKMIGVADLKQILPTRLMSAADVTKALQPGTLKKHQIVFLPEIDAIGSQEEDAQKRQALIAQVARSLAMAKKHNEWGRYQVLVCAAAGDVKRVPENVLKHFHTDHRFILGLPDESKRLAVLQAFLTGLTRKFDPQPKITCLSDLAKKSENFGFGDLEKVISRAVNLAGAKSTPPTDDGLRASLAKIMKRKARVPVPTKTITVPPKFMKKASPLPKTTFADLAPGTLPKYLKLFIDAYSAPPLEAAKYACRPTGVLLLSGPPGTGKSFSAQAACGELAKRGFDVVLRNVKATEIVSGFIGESGKNVAGMFTWAESVTAYLKKAGKKPLVVLFFDEIDTLGDRHDPTGGTTANRRIIGELLQRTQHDQMPENVLVIGATNITFDAAFSSRAQVILFEMPKEKDMPGIMKVIWDQVTKQTSSTPDFEKLALKIKDFTLRDITQLFRLTGMIARANKSIEITCKWYTSTGKSHLRQAADMMIEQKKKSRKRLANGLPAKLTDDEYRESLGIV